MSVGEIAKKVGCTPALVYNVKARMSGGVRKRGPGRPPKAKPVAASGTLAGLSGLLDAVKGTERERAQLRMALEKIQAVIAEALG